MEHGRQNLKKLEIFSRRLRVLIRASDFASTIIVLYLPRIII